MFRHIYYLQSRIQFVNANNYNTLKNICVRQRRTPFIVSCGWFQIFSSTIYVHKDYGAPRGFRTSLRKSGHRKVDI